MTGVDAGLVLAGGLSRRMGGVDKAAIDFGGEPLGARVCRRLGSQVAALAVAGGPRAGYPTDVAWLDDGVFAGMGPLAGVLAGLRWAAQRGADHLTTSPVDVPFLPFDLVVRLAEPGGLVFAAAGRTHWTAGRWPVALADALEEHMRGGDDRSVHAFANRIGFRVAVFDPGVSDPFFNVNSPDDLAEARSRAEGAAER